MMKQAGYEITWITNQQTQTRRNTMLTPFSQMADHQVYLNNNLQQNASQYDGAVLAPVATALASEAPKKLIIVHMLGTHRGYSYRYPKSFAQFTDTTGVPAWITPALLDEYNSYDNAVRYNDDVVASLIDVARERDENSLLVYFSDHGEEVYDNPEKLFTGRNEGAPTSAMYTVPFVVWASPEFKQHRDLSPWAAAVDRPYSNAHFIHTFAEMVGLSFTALQPQDSLISAEFVPSARWIGDPFNPKSLQDYNATVEEKIEKKPQKVAEAHHSKQTGI
jgi:heptose-I-phosphate ethanolaminephosphotransferase